MKSRLKIVFVCFMSFIMISSSFGLVFAGSTRTWAMAGGTADRQRRSIARIAPPLVSAWDTGGEGSIWGVRPVLSSKYAYVGFATLVDEGTSEFSKRIEKRSLNTGEVIWTYNDAWNIWGSYQGDLIVQGFDKDFRAWVKRIDGGDRHMVWEMKWNRTTRKTAIEGDVIYSLSFSDTESEDGEKKKFHFIQAHSAENSRLLWRKNYRFDKCSNTGFCVWEDSIYASIGLKLMRLSKVHGGEIWSIDLKEKLPQNSFITADENGVLYTTMNDELKMISHEDGSDIWTQKLSSYVPEEKDDTPSGSPGIMNGKVYIQSRGNYHEDECKSMYCFESKTGQLVWETKLPGTSVIHSFDVGRNVTCTKSGIYCISEAPGLKDSRLVAFDPEDGRILWSDTVAGIPYQDEIAVTTGFIVAGFVDFSDLDFPIYDYKCWTNKNVQPAELMVESDEFSFGRINEKVSKKFKIWSDTDMELIGTTESSEKWLTVSPASFSDKKVTLTLTVNPKFLEKEGMSKATMFIKTNGGDREISVSVAYGGEDGVDTKSFSFDVSCSKMDEWKEIVKLPGFHQGKVIVDSPWMIVEPSIIMGTDVEVVFKINPTQLTDDNKTATVKIETGSVSYDYTIKVDKAKYIRNIKMWIDNKIARVNGDAVTVDPPPQILQGRTMLPLRFTGEALGVEFVWVAETRSVEYETFEGEKVVLMIGNKTAKVGSKTVVIDPPPQIIDGRTMVPVRFISESLGAEVGWDGNERMVTVDLEICR